MLLNTVSEEDEFEALGFPFGKVGLDLIPIRYGGKTAGTTWSTTLGEKEYYIIVFGINGYSARWCRESKVQVAIPRQRADKRKCIL